MGGRMCGRLESTKYRLGVWLRSGWNRRHSSHCLCETEGVTQKARHLAMGPEACEDRTFVDAVDPEEILGRLEEQPGVFAQAAGVQNAIAVSVKERSVISREIAKVRISGDELRSKAVALRESSGNSVRRQLEQFQVAEWFCWGLARGGRMCSLSWPIQFRLPPERDRSGSSKGGTRPFDGKGNRAGGCCGVRHQGFSDAGSRGA